VGIGTIGVVNQDPEHLKLLDQALREHGYATVFVPEGAEAHQLIKSSQPDLVMMGTESGNGWQLVQELRLDVKTAKIPLLILSNEATADVETKAPALARHQHVALMPAPFDANVLVAQIKQMLADRPQ